MATWVPRFLLGLVIAGYWGRVAKMASRHRRKKRPANLLPRDRISRLTRALWIPVIALWIVLPFVAAFHPVAGPLLTPLGHSALLAWIGAAVAFLCLLGTVVCWKTMGRAWRMGINPHEQTPLISNGPYALARHPIYSLSQMMMAASALAVPSPLMIGAAAVHIVLIRWEAHREEAHMLSLHGQTYLDYQRRVAPFIPRFRATTA